MECSSAYQIVKDFAGPVAVIIGSAVASRIAYVFGTAQKQIASSQRDIALDKLKFDLFKSRYEIYEAAKELIEHVSLVSDIQKSDPTKIRSLYVRLDEARFYFPMRLQGVLRDLHQTCERFFEHLAARENTSIDSTAWGDYAEVLAHDQSRLREIYASLPFQFEAALAFKQLTTE